MLVNRITKIYLITLLILTCLILNVSGSYASDSGKEDAEAILFGSIKSGGEDAENPPLFLSEDPQFTWQDIENQDENPIFQHGEVLVYNVSWMGINAGTIEMSIEPDSKYKDQAAYKVVVVGKTNKTFSFFFEVHDVITSYFEKSTFNSLHYIKDVREGSYRKFKETIYDQKNRVARVKDKEYELPPNSRDPLSCIYTVRRYRAEPGDVIRLNSNSEGKSSYPVAIQFTDAGSIKLGDGVERKVMLGNPMPTWEGRVFKEKQSQAKMWMSSDEYFVPLKLETKVRIGTMKAELIRREGPGWTLNLE